MRSHSTRMDHWLAGDDLALTDAPRRTAAPPAGLPRDVQRNRLLTQLVAFERDLVRHLEKRTFAAGHVWPADVHDAPKVVFPLSAVATVVQESVDGHPAPLALIGCEGVWDTKAFSQPRGGRRKWVVHAGGDALVLDRAHVTAAGEACEDVHRALCRWDRLLLDRIAQSALCNRHHDVQQQVASWLLANQKRYRVSEANITQTVLADLLGVRRESVSRSVGKLAAARAVAVCDSGLSIASTARLKVFACECWQATE